MTRAARPAPSRGPILLLALLLASWSAGEAVGQRATWVDDALPLRLLAQGSDTVFRVDVARGETGEPVYARGETLRGSDRAAAVLFARFAQEPPWRSLVPGPEAPAGGLLAFGHERPRIDDAITSRRIVLRWATVSSLTRLGEAEARLAVVDPRRAGAGVDEVASVLDLLSDPATLRDGLLDVDLALGHRGDERVPAASRLDAELLRAAIVARGPDLRAVLRACARGVAEGRRIGRWNSMAEESHGADFDVGLVFALMRVGQDVMGPEEGEALARAVRAWLGPSGSRAGRPGPGWPSIASALERAAVTMGQPGAPALEALRIEAARHTRVALATFGHGPELDVHARACELTARELLDVLLGPDDERG